MKTPKALFILSILMIIESSLFILYLIMLYIDIGDSDWRKVLLLLGAIPFAFMVFVLITGIFGICLNKKAEKVRTCFKMGVILSCIMAFGLLLGISFFGIFGLILLFYFAAPALYTYSAYHIMKAFNNNATHEISLETEETVIYENKESL